MTTNDDLFLQETIEEMRRELGDNLWDYQSACERWGKVYETPLKAFMWLPLELKKVWREPFLKRGLTPPEPDGALVVERRGRAIWDIDIFSPLPVNDKEDEGEWLDFCEDEDDDDYF